jgi:hypothetical protein
VSRTFGKCDAQDRHGHGDISRRRSTVGRTRGSLMAGFSSGSIVN